MNKLVRVVLAGAVMAACAPRRGSPDAGPLDPWKAAVVTPAVLAAGQTATVELVVSGFTDITLEVGSTQHSCLAEAGDHWVCRFTATGQEPEGAFTLVFLAIDKQGGLTHEGPQVTFDFHCTADPLRLQLTSGYDVPERFEALPGALEPGATVALHPSPDQGSAPLATLTAGADGSVQLGPLQAPPPLFAQVTDQAGNVCGDYPLRNVFVATYVFKVPGQGGANPSVLKVDSPSVLLPPLSELEAAPEVGQAFYDAVAALDGNLAQAAVPAVSAPPTWASRATTGPSPRSQHALAYDAAHARVLLFGGKDSTGAVLNDTWTWDGTAWSQLSPATSPPARAGHVMAYDSARQVVVLFSGTDASGQYLSDTWEWDGTTWTRRVDLTPGAHALQTMAYDPDRGVSWLFASDFQSQEVWAWDGSSWAQRLVQAPNGTEGDRAPAAMVYDRARRRAVYLGAMALNNRDFPTVFGIKAWDGASWDYGTTLEYPFTFGPRPDPTFPVAAAYDVAAQRAVAFGNGQTWEWDGVNWLQRTPAASPPPRSAPALAQDPVRRVTVLFGGLTASGPAQDTWEYASPLHAYPAVYARLDVSGASAGTVLGMTLNGTVQAVSTSDADAITPEFQVFLWNVQRMDWDLGANDRTGGSFSILLAQADVPLYLSNNQVRVLLVPRWGASAVGPGQLAIDYLELRVDHQ